MKPPEEDLMLAVDEMPSEQEDSQTSQDEMFYEDEIYKVRWS